MLYKLLELTNLFAEYELEQVKVFGFAELQNVFCFFEKLVQLGGGDPSPLLVLPLDSSQARSFASMSILIVGVSLF